MGNDRPISFLLETAPSQIFRCMRIRPITIKASNNEINKAIIKTNWVIANSLGRVSSLLPITHRLTKLKISTTTKIIGLI